MSPGRSGEQQPIETEIQALFAADQADRSVGYDNIDLETMRRNDAVRLRRAHEIHDRWSRGEVALGGEPLYQLALLFQHSPTTEDYLIARNLAEKAADAGYGPGSWLAAAAEDRYLLATGQPQIWGTQFKKSAAGDWELAEMADDADSGVTDKARQERKMPTRQDLLSEFLKRDDL